MRHRLPIALIGLALCTGTRADTDQALRNCLAEPDSLKRLLCYDTLAQRAGAPAAAPALAKKPQPVEEAPAGHFGLPQPAKKPEDAVAEIRGQIQGKFLGWSANTQIALVDGQVWQVSDGSEGAYRLDAPKVRIVRGRFGGYFMEIEGISQTPRVRRLK